MITTRPRTRLTAPQITPVSAWPRFVARPARTLRRPRMPRMTAPVELSGARTAARDPRCTEARPQDRHGVLGQEQPGGPAVRVVHENGVVHSTLAEHPSCPEPVG